MAPVKRTIPPTPRKRGLKRTRKVAIPRSLKFPVPIKMRSVVRYSEQINLALPSAAAGTYVYAANGLFDPNITGIGHQPAGFDQLMLLYGRYCVEKSVISVTFSSEYNTNNYNALVGITASTDNIGSTDYRRYTENPLCTMGVIKATDGVVKLSQTYDGKGFFNMSYQSDTDKNGTVSSNPAELVYFNIFAAPTNPGNTMGFLQLQVQLEYHALFSDPVSLSGS